MGTPGHGERLPVPEDDLARQLLSNNWETAKAAQEALQAIEAAEKSLPVKGKKLPNKTLPPAPFPSAAQAPVDVPVNDLCADAIPIGNVTDLPFINVGANRDGASYFCALESDVWYCYTAPCSTFVTVRMTGANYNPSLEVYAGCACPSINPPLGCDSDQLTFLAQAGSQYLIRIGGVATSQGSGLLTVECSEPPACPPGAVAENEPCGSDLNSGCEDYPNPPMYSIISCGDTVCGTAWSDSGWRDTDWYRLVLTQDTFVTWSAVAAFPIQIAAWDISGGCYGTSLGHRFGGILDTVRLTAFLTAGTYTFFVAPYAGYGSGCDSKTVSYTAWLTCTPPPPPPANDDCANAIPIGELVDLPFSTAHATLDGPGNCISGANIWYRYTASCNSAVTLSTCGSDFPAKIAVYKGGSCDPVGPRLNCGDNYYACDPYNSGNRVNFTAAAGFTYLIEIGGEYSSDTGNGKLSIVCGPPPPANDDCANAIPIGNMPYGQSFSNLGATTDGPDEPASCNFSDYTHIESDIWYCYTAPCTGEVSVSVCGSNYDTKLAVYEGCECPVGAPPILCSDDTCGFQELQSAVVFQTTAGSRYLIRIGGYGGIQGTGTLRVNCVPPCTFTCPPGARVENEPCSTRVNNGCSYYPYAFDPIACGDIVCGTIFADTYPYDSDWYRVTFPSDTFVTWSAVGEFPVSVSIVNLTNGCSESPLAVGSVSRCDTARITASLTAGVYAFIVQANGYANLYCVTGPHEYVAWLECAPPSPPPANNDCANAEPIGEVANLAFSMEWATHDGPGQCFNLPNVWFRYTASCTAPVTVSTYGSSFSPQVAIYKGGSCNPLGPQISCGSYSGGSFYATAGETYLIEVGRYACFYCPPGMTGVLTITCGSSCAVTCPPGARAESEPCDSSFNNGCNYYYGSPKVDAITCGDTVCGTVDRSQSYPADVDWFQKVLTGDSTRVTWSAVAEFPIQIYIRQAGGGGNPCNGIIIAEDNTYGLCDTVRLTSTLTPGTYWFGIAPSYSGPPLLCLTGPHEYVAWLEGDCCPHAKGDLDGEGNKTASDVVLMLNCAFLGVGYCDYCFADVNCDNGLSPSDVVALLMAAFLGEPLPCI